MTGYESTTDAFDATASMKITFTFFTVVPADRFFKQPYKPSALTFRNNMSLHP